MSKIPRMAALLRAQQFSHLCAARKSARIRKRKPLRLPGDTWNAIEELAKQLQSAFPNRYVTLNSTVEFLIAEGLSVVLTDDIDLRSKKVPLDIEADLVSD